MKAEEGAVAIVVALCCLVLFVFGAFAVDIGAAYSERRANQNSADSAALAGANALPDMGGSTQDAMRDAVSYVEANLVEPEGGWADAWSDCTDPDHLAQTSTTHGECISVSAFDTRVRVVIPNRIVRTTLASAFGVSGIPVSAEAESQIEYSFGSDVLPFALTSGTTSSEVCIRAGPTSTEPCEGPADGNFGTLNFTHFGNASLGTVTQCSGDMGNSGRLSRNIALGVDHPLSVHPGPVNANANSPGDRTDEDMCADGADHGSRPNATETQAGLRAQVLEESLLGEFDYMGRTIEGRFRQIPESWPSTWNTVTISGKVEDNRGLWTYMPQVGEPGYDALVAAAPAPCDPAVVSTHDEMKACLDAHASAASTAPLFERDENGDGLPDLLASPRFAWVPLLWELELTTGVSGPFHFLRFEPVFLDALRYDCKKGSSGPATCSSWWAGHAPPSPLKGRPQELTAFRLSAGSLPAAVLDAGPFSGGTPTVVLHH